MNSEGFIMLLLIYHQPLILWTVFALNLMIFAKSPDDSVSSVSQSCPGLCDPMDCSMPGFPVHHQLPESTQTYVHWVDEAIKPSHPLLYWRFNFNISPSNEHPGLISFRMDWLDLLAVQRTLKSLQHHSSKASILRRSAFFTVQLTSIHDHWKNHS